MKTYLDCIPCLVRQALEASRLATSDEDKRRETMRKVLGELSKVPFERSPPQICYQVHQLIREATGNEDPYSEVKKEFNEAASEMYPKLRKILVDSEDKLLTAVKLAIAGNVIDVGPGNKFDLGETVKRVLSADFGVNDFDHLRRELKRNKEVVYLADNAGEVFFDRLLIEVLRDKRVIYVVKESPLLNDASMEDAKLAGIDEVAEVVAVKIDPETIYAPSEAELLRKAGIVISKGQGNYEALSDVDANIFFLLMIKCPVVAEDIGGKVGDIVVKHSRR